MLIDEIKKLLINKIEHLKNGELDESKAFCFIDGERILIGAIANGFLTDKETIYLIDPELVIVNKESIINKYNDTITTIIKDNIKIFVNCKPILTLELDELTLALIFNPKNK